MMAVMMMMMQVDKLAMVLKTWAKLHARDGDHDSDKG